MLQAVANALITMKFEWQLMQKEMKLKCRTKFNEMEFSEDTENDYLIEQFLQKNFIKFHVQIFKWSKDLPDMYMVDFQMIKAGSAHLFLHTLSELRGHIVNEAQTNFQLEIIPTIGISEETNPSKG